MNCEDAISYWPETATAVAIRLNTKNELECIAPHGLSDLFTLVVQPTINFNHNIYKNRMAEKKWQQRWPLLQIHKV